MVSSGVAGIRRCVSWLVAFVLAVPLVVFASPLEVSATGTYGERVLADAPVGFWGLDELSGTTAFDTSGSGFHAEYRGSAGSFVLGQPSATGVGASVFVDGAEGFVYVADSGEPGNLTPEADALSPEEELTIELFFKPDAVPEPGSWHQLARWRWFGWGQNGQVQFANADEVFR